MKTLVFASIQMINLVPAVFLSTILVPFDERQGGIGGRGWVKVFPNKYKAYLRFLPG